ncbi:hypothetical protein LJ753_10880 [Arthrobacter sp. zg-Y20]|uniref:hypothetical protein n=1 Tax=unclassified Arthrobacter TaxID=235627 RepID=UPI001D1589B8|nr:MULTISPECIES: hypothetical protein [unclassified Arthrobacter]MCC3276374.1 hypothetical protein [Arthrobacter sp. zg-Y20]MDK1316533.1 hypothetical protein [Arthrobacter sp. zg.Y20]WIB06574.1 hypothetical protein QNO06_02180 [Arthrobacter sp. zg-Y20]
MATRKNATNPDTPDAAAASGETGEPATSAKGAAVQVTEPERTPSVRKVYVYDTNTPKPHFKLSHPVPESWLSRFKNLKQVPSDKGGADTPKEGK